MRAGAGVALGCGPCRCTTGDGVVMLVPGVDAPKLHPIRDFDQPLDLGRATEQRQQLACPPIAARSAWCAMTHPTRLQ